MKFIIATSALVVLVVAMASIAHGHLYESVEDCPKWNEGDVCDECCKTFNKFPAAGRRSFLFPSEHVCKCVTREEKDVLVAKEREEDAKWSATPRYESVRSCSGWNFETKDQVEGDICRDCCGFFKLEASKGRPSVLVKHQHVCRCKKPKEVKVSATVDDSKSAESV